MKVFWNVSKDVRHCWRNMALNLLLGSCISVVAITLFASVLMNVAPCYNYLLEPNSFHCWWADTRYCRAIGFPHFVMYCGPADHGASLLPPGGLNPYSYNYTLRISDKAQWSGQDYIAKYRSLLNDVRSDRLVHRRSHVQDLGTRVTCWPDKP